MPYGLNPAAAAAVAALSQLTQFAGTMDAAERAMAGMHDRQWPGKYGPGGGGSGGPMQMDMPPYMAPPTHHGPYPGHRGGRAPHRGGGRRGGGGPFRGGGGRGNVGHRPPRTDGSNPQFRGRGRGRGGNRRSQQRGVSSQPETVPTGELALEQANVGTSIVMQEETPLTATVPPAGAASRKVGPPGKASSTRRQPQIAWCELCRVDCTSLDILEQHKNGKKHKKNMQRFEELQKAGKSMPMTLQSTPAARGPVTAPAPAASTPMLGTDNSTSSVGPGPTPSSDPSVSLSTTPQPEVQTQQQQSLSESKPDEREQAENVQGGVTNAAEAPENKPTKVNDDGSTVEAEQKNDNLGHPVVKVGEPSEAPGKKRRHERLDTRKRGMNKKMRGGRGAKRMRNFERPTRSAEPPKPKEVVPILCDLCNVKCDTAAVFQTHLAGKKHMSKLKRFQGHHAMFGPLGLQALYPPNPNTQPMFVPQVHHQTMYASQGHFHQPAAYVPHAQGATFSEPQTHVTWDGSQNDMPLEFKGPEGAIVGQGQPVVGYMPESNVAVLEEKAPNNHSETSVPPHSKNTVNVSENVSSAKDEAITAVAYGITTSENATFPGPDAKMNDAVITNDGST